MAWSTIRRATEADREAIREAAERFCARHGLHDAEMGAELTIDCALTPGRGDREGEMLARRLRPLWLRIVRRVFDSKAADGIAYGHVGYHVE